MGSEFYWKIILKYRVADMQAYYYYEYYTYPAAGVFTEVKFMIQ